MKFSAQEEYGLRCLIAIARLGTLTIPELSRLEGLSQPHVAKLLSILRRGGFLLSNRGQAGGYILARQPEEIVVGAVLADLGGRLYEPDFCEKHSGVQEECAHSVGCSLKELWSRVQSAVDQVVYQITLKDLIEESANSGEWVALQKVPRKASLRVTQSS